jgi:ribosome maturation protein Sdo1
MTSQEQRQLQQDRRISKVVTALKPLEIMARTATHVPSELVLRYIEEAKREGGMR